MSHIFISYSHSDSVYAHKLAKALKRAGFSVWIDEKIEEGEQWFTTITKAITDSAAIIVIMSSQAEESEWVQKEILLAKREEKPIFPLLLEGKDFDLLIDIQHIDVKNGKLPKSNFYDRLGKLSPRRQSLRTPTPTGSLDTLADENALLPKTAELENALTKIIAGLNLIDRFTDKVSKPHSTEPRKYKTQASQEDGTLVIKSVIYPEIRRTANDLHLNEWDDMRYQALSEKTFRNFEQYNNLDKELPMLSIDEKVRIKQRMEQIKQELCKDFREMKVIYEKTLNVILDDHYSLYFTCAPPIEK